MAVNLNNLVRVEDIVHAYKNKVPMYTADGVYQVTRVYDRWFSSGNHCADLHRVDDIGNLEHEPNAWKEVEYTTAGEVPHFDPTTHHMTIMADKDTTEYYCTYTAPGLTAVSTPDTPEDTIKRDTYLREVMYPRLREHEMD